MAPSSCSGSHSIARGCDSVILALCVRRSGGRSRVCWAWVRGGRRIMAPQPPFNPDTAPKVKMTDEERRAVSRDMNKVAMKLHDAGIQLYGFYKIHDLVPYWNPTGFDFICDNWQQLMEAADRAPRLGYDLIDM